jgi:hypothetical protein
MFYSTLKTLANHNAINSKVVGLAPDYFAQKALDFEVF